MPCGGCRKRQKRKISFDPNAGKGSIQKQLKDMTSKGLTMVQSFAMSMASRGLRNKKVEKPVKQLRVLSCFGNGDVGPCEHLKRSSKKDGMFYCGECGCGDKESSWLIPKSEKYSKLDHPKLNCPLSMPGFTNYSTDNESERKLRIESINIDEISNIAVSMPKIEE